MKRILKAVGVLTTLIVGGGVLLPNSFEVKRRINIQSPPESIHPYVNNLGNWSEWSPWHTPSQSKRITIGQPGIGEGAQLSWQDTNGEGALIIVNSNAEQGIKYDVTYSQETLKYSAVIRYRPVTITFTDVTWIMSGEMNIPILGPYLVLAMRPMIGDSLEAGLKNLKQIIENEPLLDITTQ